ncbi:hypothetical protein [Aestuariivita boseongensis]|uniref:hypothetical protein n=1 Tax=Aestuariivita boseongensis TaxID=1470562 RepID=UPI0006816DD8|nr:hypothetical protein [Aestuariivita boseongensis]
MGRDPQRGLRVLIGASSFADSAAALRIVAALPAVTLGGVFVDQTHLIATCRISTQQVVLPSGAKMGPPDPSRLRTMANADARAFQTALENAAKLARAESVFARQEGDLVATSLREAREWDVLAIGYDPVNRIGGKVVLLQDPDRMREDLASTATALCHRFTADRVSLSLNDGLSALTRVNALVVLLDARAAWIKAQGGLERVIEASRCPVIVFGASEGFEEVS